MNVKLLVASISLVLLTAGPAWGQVFNSGSDESDGALAPLTSTSIELPEDGILNYTTVDIPKGVTVTFIRNKHNTNVYILASGAISVAGKIDVSGQKGVASTGLHGFSYLGGLGGPGGSDGGSWGFGHGAGFGPGSGLATGGGGNQAAGGAASPINNGSGGSCCNCGANASGGSSWADIGMFFLHGGSGGGGANGVSGGGGGGAILLASSTKITVDGDVEARGGSAFKNSSGGGGGGSGGSIRLAAPEVTGTGNLVATRSTLSCGGSCNPGCGADGVIRIETFDLNGDIQANAAPGAIVTLPEKGFPYPVDERPRLEITKVGSKFTNLPAYTNHTHTQPGVKVPRGQEIVVRVAAKYVPLGTKVNVILNTQGHGRFEVESVGLTGTLEESVATALVTVPADMSIGTVEAWIPTIDVLNNP